MLSSKAHRGQLGTRAPVPSFSTQCKLTSLHPRAKRFRILRPLLANSGGQESLEKVLLDELIASRRQVDTLLHQQNVLLSLVARGQVLSQAEVASPARGPLEPPSYPSSPSNGQTEQRNPMLQASAASPPSESTRTVTPKAAPPSTGNPVADILRQSGAVTSDDVSTRAGGSGDSVESSVLSHIQAALSAVEESDVLADLPTSTSFSSRRISSGAAPTPTSQAQPAAGPTNKMVPQPELASSGACLSGEAGELVPLPLLKLGDASAFWVEILQVALMAHGLKTADEGFTYGPATESTVKRFQFLYQLPETGTTDASTWASLLSKLPQLREDTIRKVASGTAAAVIDWGRNNANSNLISMTGGSAGGSEPSTIGSTANTSSTFPRSVYNNGAGLTGGNERSTGNTASTFPSSNSSTGAGLTADFPASSAFNSRSSSSSSDGAVGGSGPVGVNFFSDISEMAAEEAREEAEKNTSTSRSGKSSSGTIDSTGTDREFSEVAVSSSGSGSRGSKSGVTSGDNGEDGNMGSNNGSSNSGVNSNSRSTSSRKAMPELSLGDDDLEWVSVLHRGLQKAGYYPTDDECENWLFGEGTQEALLTLQACSGLPETGIVCSRTWEVLLSSDTSLREEAHSRAAARGKSAGCQDAGGSDEQEQEDQEGWMEDEEAARALSSASSGGKWPVLTEMEGGKHVQLMQLALSSQGYNCGEDDMQYWMFGEMTGNALRTFQACAGLKETGVCDERTWRALLGQTVSPEDLPALREQLLKEARARGEMEDFVEDITESKEGKVWLVGEQRWEAQ